MKIAKLLPQLALLSHFALAPLPALAANKLDLGFGFYSLSGKTKSGGGSLSGLGTYRIGYRHSVSSRLDLGVAYNLLYSSIFSGDSVYGIDVGLTYFPLTLGGMQEYRRNGQSLTLQPDLRPFLTAGFSQRGGAFATGYSGFSVGAGAEKSWTASTSVMGTLRYTTLSGSSSATATIVDVLLGMSFGF